MLFRDVNAVGELSDRTPRATLGQTKDRDARNKNTFIPSQSNQKNNIHIEISAY